VVKGRSLHDHRWRMPSKGGKGGSEAKRGGKEKGGEEMRKILTGKTFWTTGYEKGWEDVRVDIQRGGLFIWCSYNSTISAPEWDSLCEWVKQKKAEGRLWKEKP